jgi:hypothetical protein
MAAEYAQPERRVNPASRNNFKKKNRNRLCSSVLYEEPPNSNNGGEA